MNTKRYTHYFRMADNVTEKVAFDIPGYDLWGAFEEIVALRMVNEWNRQAATQPGPVYRYWLD